MLKRMEVMGPQRSLDCMVVLRRYTCRKRWCICSAGADKKCSWRCGFERQEQVEGKSSVRFVQVFSDNSAMELKSRALVAYPVHDMLLNKDAMYRQNLVEKRLSLVGFLLLKMETCKESDLSGEGRASAHTIGSLRRRRGTWRKGSCCWERVVRGI